MCSLYLSPLKNVSNSKTEPRYACLSMQYMKMWPRPLLEHVSCEDTLWPQTPKPMLTVWPGCPKSGIREICICKSISKSICIWLCLASKCWFAFVYQIPKVAVMCLWQSIPHARCAFLLHNKFEAWNVKLLWNIRFNRFQFKKQKRKHGSMVSNCKTTKGNGNTWFSYF